MHGKEQKIMREILFKAKDKDTGYWYEGYYWRTDDTTYCFEEDYKRDPDNRHHYILFDQMIDWGLPNRKLQAEIDPDTICQYTGLTDKNGKKIFEGDILKTDKFIGVIEYNEIISAFVAKINDSTDEYYHWSHLNEGDVGRKHKLQYTEVIGNIFNNPDLLTTSSIDLD